MRIASGLRGPFSAAVFCIAILACAARPAAAQTAGDVIPAPPFIVGANGGVHHADQDPMSPSTAHDSQTGQDLKWDGAKKTWVDTKTGQALGFDGQLARDGSVIPAPPFIDSDGIGLHQAMQYRPGPSPDDHAAEFADDVSTGQMLYWDSTNHTWRNTRTHEAVGFNGALANETGAPEQPPPAAPPAPPAKTAAVPASAAGGPCPTNEDCVELKRIYDEADAAEMQAETDLSHAIDDRSSDVTQAGLLLLAAKHETDQGVADSEKMQAQALQDKLPYARAIFNAASSAAFHAWANYANCIDRLKNCPPKETAPANNGTGTPSSPPPPEAPSGNTVGGTTEGTPVSTPGGTAQPAAGAAAPAPQTPGGTATPAPAEGPAESPTAASGLETPAPSKSGLAADLCARAKALRDIAATDRQNAAAAQNPRDRKGFSDDATMMEGMAKLREDQARAYDPDACPPHATSNPGGSSTAENQTGSPNAGGTPATGSTATAAGPPSEATNTVGNGMPSTFKTIAIPPYTTPGHPGASPWVTATPGDRLWNQDEFRYYGSNPDGTPRASEQPQASSSEASSQTSSASSAGGISGITSAQCGVKPPVAASASSDGTVDISEDLQHCPSLPSSLRFGLGTGTPVLKAKVEVDPHDGSSPYTIPATPQTGNRYGFEFPAAPAGAGTGNFDLKLTYSSKPSANLIFRERLSYSIETNYNYLNWNAPVSNGQVGAFTSSLGRFGNRFLNDTPVNYLDQTTTGAIPNLVTNGSPDTIPPNFPSYSLGTNAFPYQGTINGTTGALTLGYEGYNLNPVRGGVFTYRNPFFPPPSDENSITPGGAFRFNGFRYLGTEPVTPPATGVTGNPLAGYTQEEINSIGNSLRRAFATRLPYQLFRPGSYYDDGPQYFDDLDPGNDVPYDCSWDFPDALRAFPEVAAALAADAESHARRRYSASYESSGAHIELASYRRSSPATQPQPVRRPARAAASPAPETAAASVSAPLPSVPTISYSIVSNGKSTGYAFDLSVNDPTGKIKSVRMAEGTILEAIKPGAAQPVSAPAGDPVIKQQLNAYCIEFHKQPPAAGTQYRIADDAVQQKYASLRFLSRAAAQMSQANQFHPDSNADAYKNAILQYALWSKLEGWGQDQFAQNFVARTKENADALHISWTKQMEDALLGAAPGRWRDISEMLTQAQALEKASADRATARRSRRQQQ